MVTESCAVDRWFQEAINAGWREYRKVERDPLWEPLRNEPQFQPMISEVKADLDRQLQRVEAMEPELKLYLSR